MKISAPAAPDTAAILRRQQVRSHDSVVRLLPPLTITDEQVEAVSDRPVDAISTESR